MLARKIITEALTENPAKFKDLVKEALDVRGVAILEAYKKLVAENIGDTSRIDVDELLSSSDEDLEEEEEEDEDEDEEDDVDLDDEDLEDLDLDDIFKDIEDDADFEDEEEE